MDVWVWLACFVAVAARWGDRARFLFSWDAHTFALALERYDVNALRPHAPGYPVFVVLGRIANAVFHDANDAYIAVSIAATIAAAIVTYTLGAWLVGRLLALAATALLLAAPLVHIHAMTTNAYAAEMAFGSFVAAAAWVCHKDPSRRNLVVLAALFGVAVGVRQSLGFLLLPLVAWAALRPPFSLRTQVQRLVAPVLVGVAVGLAWFLPMIRATGGLAVWRRANRLQGQVVTEHAAWVDGWTAVANNAKRIHLYLRWESEVLLPLLAAVVALALVVALARKKWTLKATPHAREAATFLALWTVPGFAFYLTVYSGYGNAPSGYMLLMLPAVYIGIVWIAWIALGSLSISWRPTALLGVALLLSGMVGLLGHAHDAPDLDYRINDDWAEDWSHLDEAFPPSNTSIVTAYNFAHLWFYEPEYHVYEYRPAGKAVGEVPDFLLIQESYRHEATPDWYDEIADHRTPLNHTLAPGVENLVLFDFQLAGENGGTRALKDDVMVHEGFLPNGWRILYVRTTPDRPLLEDYFTLENLGYGQV
jgi:hypothetical protein